MAGPSAGRRSRSDTSASPTYVLGSRSGTNPPPRCWCSSRRCRRERQRRWLPVAQVSLVVRTDARRNLRETGVLARRALLSGLFPGHPYSAFPSPERVSQLREGQADDWLSRELRPGRATLLVVSDQEPGPELWSAIEDEFGGWSTGDGRPPVAIEAPPLPPKRTVVLVDRRGGASPSRATAAPVPAPPGRPCAPARRAAPPGRPGPGRARRRRAPIRTCLGP